MHQRPSLPSSVVIAGWNLADAVRERMTLSLRSVALCSFCDTEMEFARSAILWQARLLVADLHGPGGEPMLPTLAAIRARCCHLPLIILLRNTPESVRTLLRVAGTVGVHDVILRDVEDPAVAIRRVLSTSCSELATGRILHALRPIVASGLWPFISYCAVEAEHAVSVAEVAAALHVSRRTLSWRLRRAGLPEPARVIAWCRLCHAASMLCESDRAVDEIAGILDFPSGNALQNMLRRYVGRTTSDIRQVGGVELVLSRFRNEMSGVSCSASALSHCAFS